ncbi:MAG: nucleotidyltransferase domain-containing protein [Thermodesulfobacteriota bacterium]
MHTRKDLLERLPVILARFPEISFAYLFGSRAEGRERQQSDIDIAIYVRPDFRIDRLELSSILSAELEGVTDLVILNQAPAAVCHQVLKTGVLLIERIPEERKRFEIVARKLYEDYLYLHKRYMTSVRREYGKKYG